MKKVILSLGFACMATFGFSQCDAVYSINENFDDWEEIDECWSTVSNGGMIYADSNVTFYGFMGGNISMYLISPEIVEGSYVLNFDASTLSLDGGQTEGVTLQVGTVTSSNDMNSFNSVSESYALLNDGQTVQVPVTFSAEAKYFAVKISVSVPHSAAGIDNLTLVPNTAGTNDLNAQKAQIYPNPVKEQMNISSQITIQQVKVFNMAGQMLVSSKVDNKTASLNLSSFKSGVYAVQIITSEGVETKKIIKK